MLKMEPPPQKMLTTRNWLAKVISINRPTHTPACSERLRFAFALFYHVTGILSTCDARMQPELFPRIQTVFSGILRIFRLSFTHNTNDLAPQLTHSSGFCAAKKEAAMPLPDLRVLKILQIAYA